MPLNVSPLPLTPVTPPYSADQRSWLCQSPLLVLAQVPEQALEPVLRCKSEARLALQILVLVLASLISY